MALLMAQLPGLLPIRLIPIRCRIPRMRRLTVSLGGAGFADAGDSRISVALGRTEAVTGIPVCRSGYVRAPFVRAVRLCRSTYRVAGACAGLRTGPCPVLTFLDTLFCGLSGRLPGGGTR